MNRLWGIKKVNNCIVRIWKLLKNMYFNWLEKMLIVLLKYNWYVINCKYVKFKFGKLWFMYVFVKFLL